MRDEGKSDVDRGKDCGAGRQDVLGVDENDDGLNSIVTTRRKILLGTRYRR
jgi:hypothetical protein